MGFQDTPEHINKNGRPKKENCLTDLMKAHLSNDNNKNKQEFIERVYELAMDGDSVCMKLIWNYLDGMPIQKIDANINPRNELLERLDAYNPNNTDIA